MFLWHRVDSTWPRWRCGAPTRRECAEEVETVGKCGGHLKNPLLLQQRLPLCSWTSCFSSPPVFGWESRALPSMAPLSSCVPVLSTLPWLPELTHVRTKPQPVPLSSCFLFLLVPLYLFSKLLSLPGFLLLLLANSHLDLRWKSAVILVPSSVPHHLCSNIYQGIGHFSASILISTQTLAAPQRQKLFLHFFFKSPEPSSMSKIEEELVQVHKTTETESSPGFTAKS